MISIDDILYDVVLTIPLFIWALFVTQFLSHKIYDFAIKKGYSGDSATYFGRKFIHIFASGLIALLIPFFFREPLLPFISAMLLAVYTFLPHIKNKLYNWFQIKENLHEVNFCLMWGLVILVGWFFDKTFWLGVVPALFLSFGDGITGVIRNLKYKKRTKAWEGSLAMFFVCALIGLKFGWPGVIAAFLATIVEKIDFIDDNISVPLVSFLILLFLKICIP